LCGSLGFSEVKVPFSLAERRFFVSGRGRGLLCEHLSHFGEVFGQGIQGTLHGFDLALQPLLDSNQGTRVGSIVEGSLRAPCSNGVFVSKGLFCTPGLLATRGGQALFFGLTGTLLCDQRTFGDLSLFPFPCRLERALAGFFGIGGKPSLHRGEVGASLCLVGRFSNVIEHRRPRAPIDIGTRCLHSTEKRPTRIFALPFAIPRERLPKGEGGERVDRITGAAPCCHCSRL